jgi:hypothetical protein
LAFCLALAAFWGSPGLAQTLTTILNNGPTANRINIVVLSEGYQTSQLGTFLRDATNVVQSMLASPPYLEYSNYFNAFAIAVASNQSGSDHHTPTTTLVDTYFNSTYDSYGVQRLVTIPPNDWDANYADGQGKVDALLRALMPEYDIPLMVVNDTQYGGSGGSVLISSVNSASPEIVVHESGHNFGKLTDEYSSAYPGWVPVEYPNATAQTNRALIKWTAWIAASTPIPTPSTYTSVEGLFLGAEYQTSGWYRPKYDCKMNHLGIPFCDVCSEQLVKSTCETVSLLDAFSPAATNLSIGTGTPLAFSVVPLRPRTHSLSLQWFTNGTAVAAATNAGFSLLPASLRAGSNLLQVQVRDSTPLVRNDPQNVLSNSVAWMLNVSISQLQLTSARWLGGGKFTFAVVGVAPNGFVIQASSDLKMWVPVATNFLAGGSFQFTNSAAGTFPALYYRAAILP